MLNIKTLIAATLLSGVAVASFAQAPATPAKPAPVTTAATAPAAAPVAAPADMGAPAKPAAKKVKHHAKKAVAAKTTTEAPAK